MLYFETFKVFDTQLRLEVEFEARIARGVENAPAHIVVDDDENEQTDV